MNYLREIVAFILLLSRVFIPNRKSNILSIYFHNPSKKVFENVLKWLVANKYTFISTEKLYKIILAGIEPDERMVCITFDDGWNKNLELIDLIGKYRVPVTIFIPTEAVEEGNYWFEYASISGQERYTNIKKKEHFKKLPENEFVEKVRKLKQTYSLSRSCITMDEMLQISQHELITIGSHTITHPILDKSSRKKQEQELIESKAQLKNWLKKDISFLAYPNGDFNELTIAIAKQCGYKLCFSTMLDSIDLKSVNPYIIPRRAMNDNGGYYENIAKILGIWQKVYFKNKFFFKEPV